MDEAVDEGDDAGGGGEHVGPFREGFVGRDEDGRSEVPAGDDLEEEVGIAVVVVEVSDLIDREKLRAGEAAQSPSQGCVGVLSGELVEHVRGGGEAGGEAVEDGVVEEVFDQHRLADTVRTDEHDVGGIDEGEGEEFFDEEAVDALGPGPVEVGDGFEGADARVGQSPFEGASFAFAVFDVDDALDPGLGDGSIAGAPLPGRGSGVRQQTPDLDKAPYTASRACSRVNGVVVDRRIVPASARMSASRSSSSRNVTRPSFTSATSAVRLLTRPRPAVIPCAGNAIVGAELDHSRPVDFGGAAARRSRRAPERARTAAANFVAAHIPPILPALSGTSSNCVVVECLGRPSARCTRR